MSGVCKACFAGGDSSRMMAARHMQVSQDGATVEPIYKQV
jgi:hypothetical protein